MGANVVITGANRGIGLELARQYAGEGWRVFACCRSPENAAELNALAGASGGGVSVHPLEVTNTAQRRAFVQMLGDTPIDVLLNNAGIYGQTDAVFGNTDVQRWLDAMHVNAIAPLKMVEDLADHVAASDRKVAAVLSSKMGSIADNHSGGSYVYRSSKAALNAVMASAAVDLRSRGIAVAVLHPGWVRTDMGGPNGEISARESAHNLRGIIDGITLEQSGRFFDIDGTIIPW